MADFAMIEGDVVVRDTAGNAVGVVLDGSVYRLQSEAKIRSGAKGTSVAAELTSAPVDADTEALHTSLATELPAGVQEIGSVAQGTKAAGADGWPVVLYDSAGNAAAVILDNSIYRLETRSKVTGQVQGAGAEVNVTVIADTQVAAEKRLQTEARLAPGSTVSLGTSIPSDPSDLEVEFLTNGGSEDMLVDGSVTPVVFEFQPPAAVVLSVQQLLVVFTADDFAFDGASFGPNVALTNGIRIELDVDGTVTEIFNIKQNEDFLRVPGRIPLVNNTGPKDVLGAAFDFGSLLKLDQSADDKIIVTIRDDLTGPKLKYLTMTVYGAEE